MTFFFVRFALLTLFLFLFLQREFSQRKAQGIPPRNLREFFNMGAKWQKGSDPRISALLFASSAFVGFCIWESFFISILDLAPWLKLGLPLGVIAAAVLLRQRDKFHFWTQREALWALAALGLITGALFCWVLFPWVYFRSLFLKKPQNS